MDQNLKFGGTIGYGNSYLELFFRRFKVFRLHAILHGAAVAGPGYCYSSDKDPIPVCLLT